MLNSMIRKICKTRLDRWGIILGNNESTPIVLVGVGHNNKEGDLHVVTCENMTDEAVAKFMVQALEEMLEKL